MAPVTTVSGYGARSRDIAYSLIKSEKYNVRIWPTRWGNTPMNALDPANPKHKMVLDCLMSEPKLDSQPEVFIQITVPNEFQRLGKFNIGITAGIETTIASAPWIEGCNNMDLVLTSSEHSKNVLKDSVWMKKDEKTGNYKASKSKGVKVMLQPGDMLVYRGNELEHWRDKLSFDDCGQVFLHYNNVETKGSKENIYDRRPHLGLPAWFAKK